MRALFDLENTFEESFAMRRMKLIALAAVSGLFAVASVTLARDDASEGVKVRRLSIVRNLIPAAQIEQSAAQQYLALKSQAASRRALVPAEHPQSQRLQRIARDLLPHAAKWNPRSKEWKWEVSLINSPNINAFCMPGGKIAFFAGILEKLKLTDDETAMIMGHEMAHALREHARARTAKNTITQIGSRIIGALLFGQAGEAIGAAGGSLLTLKFSRDDEKEADLIGMELAARAGYDPASGVTLWQKMDQAAKGAPPQWISTHPASKARIKLIRDSLKDVAGLYERGRAARLVREQKTGLPTPAAVEPAPRPTSPWNQTPASGKELPTQLPLPLPGSIPSGRSPVGGQPLPAQR